MSEAKEKLLALLPDVSVDYRIAKFEGQTAFTSYQIETAWRDGVQWGFNAAHYPIDAAPPNTAEPEPWWVAELRKHWSEGETTADTRRAALVALQQFGAKPLAIDTGPSSTETTP